MAATIGSIEDAAAAVEAGAEGVGLLRTEFLFLEENVAGEIHEWWLHAPTNFWFVARRTTVTDAIIETMTYDAFEARRRAPAGPGGAR